MRGNDWIMPAAMNIQPLDSRVRGNDCSRRLSRSLMSLDCRVRGNDGAARKYLPLRKQGTSLYRIDNTIIIMALKITVS